MYPRTGCILGMGVGMDVSCIHGRIHGLGVVVGEGGGGGSCYACSTCRTQQKGEERGVSHKLVLLWNGVDIGK